MGQEMLALHTSHTSAGPHSDTADITKHCETQSDRRFTSNANALAMYNYINYKIT